MKKTINQKSLQNLMEQVLETELGGKQIYEKALVCAVNPELKEEWGEYLTETLNHIEVARNCMQELGFDPDLDSALRRSVRLMAEGLIAAMDNAKKTLDKHGAELVAAQCVVAAETCDHMNWELVGFAAKGTKGNALANAQEEVEPDEDHHLYHSKGWARELWLKALGLPAVLPPPEEVNNVETAIGAARAQSAREEMI